MKKRKLNPDAIAQVIEWLLEAPANKVNLAANDPRYLGQSISLERFIANKSKKVGTNLKLTACEFMGLPKAYESSLFTDPRLYGQTSLADVTTDDVCKLLQELSAAK